MSHLHINTMEEIIPAIKKDFIADGMDIKETKLEFKLVSEDRFTYEVKHQGVNTLLEVEFSIIYNKMPFALYDKMSILDLLENKDDIQYFKYTMRDSIDEVLSSFSYRLEEELKENK